MSKEMQFFIYLLENYAKEKNLSTAEVLEVWEKKNIINKILDNYLYYHTEAIENAYKDIDNLSTFGEHIK